MAEVDWLPRTLWQVKPGEINRLTLARTPNWKESDPNDVMREWWTWENPEWWKENSRFHRMNVNGRDLHLGIDSKNFTRPASDYVGATVWTEWGIVMGSPYPARIEAFDSNQKGVAFRGPWTFDMLEVIIRGNRYHLEDKSWMLDEPGEFWVERTTDRNATIYLRLPDDSDPNQARIEAGKAIHMIDAKQLQHVHISGLAFRFTNIHWDYNIPQWAHPDLNTAVIRLNGGGDDIQISHNTFDHVHMPIRIRAAEVTQRIGHVRISDNQMTNTDHGAIQVSAKFGEGQEARYAPVDRVEVLRNSLTRIGWRILSGEHGHAVDLTFPTTSHVAGNMLYRIAGWGLCIFGGKPSGVSGPEIPFNRHLMHHNRVQDVLVKSNDWGGIETWQGGPQYVFNNIVLNPIAFKHWTWREGDKTNLGSFGHAYYLDGGFKHYYFNNIAAGRNNELGTRSVNTTALQGIFSFENIFFHNTFFRFAEAVRQQEPSGGRITFLSNVLQDVSKLTLRQADPSDQPPDPNAAHYQQGGKFAYDTLAYGRNVFSNLRGSFGVFEETGAVYSSLDAFRAALRKVSPFAGDVGILSPASVLRAPAQGDFRPVAGGGAFGQGSVVFVPWPLYGVAGEWHFIRNNRNPSVVHDHHWTMTANYGRREGYKDTPRYPLTAHNVTAADYGKGELEDWADGAVTLNGRNHYLTIPASRLSAPEVQATSRVVNLPFGKATIPSFAVPGRPFEIIVELNSDRASQQVRADLHWLKREGYGGFMSWGGVGEKVGDRKLRFRLEPSSPDGLDRYTLLIYASPNGNYENRIGEANVDVPRADFRATVNPSAERTVDMGTNSFLIELVLKTSSPTGALVCKRDGQAGYLLELVAGKPVLRLNSGSQTYTVTMNRAINDGKWHHLVVEVDRVGTVSTFLNGQAVAAMGVGTMPKGSLSNASDFYVGGGTGLAPFAGSFDFLRLARGTLPDARTTIEELYAWQFGGPQFRDFVGNPRRGRSAAGALGP
jgi:hypothetical protein